MLQFQVLPESTDICPGTAKIDLCPQLFLLLVAFIFVVLVFSLQRLNLKKYSFSARNVWLWMSFIRFLNVLSKEHLLWKFLFKVKFLLIDVWRIILNSRQLEINISSLSYSLSICNHCVTLRTSFNVTFFWKVLKYKNHVRSTAENNSLQLWIILK